MDISRKTDYALRMLTMLVKSDGGLLSVRVAAEQNDIPYSFARSIQHGLVQAGIVQSLRGVHGGMRLAVDPEKVTVLQIVEAVQGPLYMSACAGGDLDCPRKAGCCYHPIWSGVHALVTDYLGSVTLADAVRGDKNPRVDPKFTDPEAFSSYADFGGCPRE